VAAARLDEVSAVFHVHTHPRVLDKPAIQFGHVDDVLIDLNYIDGHFRKLTVEESRERSSAQADNQYAPRALSKGESSWKHPGIRQIEVAGVRQLHDALRNSLCAKPKRAQARLILRQKNGLKCGMPRHQYFFAV